MDPLLLLNIPKSMYALRLGLNLASEIKTRLTVAYTPMIKLLLIFG